MKSFPLGLGTKAMLVLGAGAIYACAVSESEAPREDDTPHEIPHVDSGAPEDAAVEGGCDDAAGCVTTTDCTIVDFCARPHPAGRTTALNAVWGTGPDDVWIVGNRGTVLHGQSGSFEVVPTGSTETFFAVWGTSKTDVWFLDGRSPLHSKGFADGAATLERVLGASWNEQYASMGRLWAGYSASPDTVWLGGEPTSRFTDFFGNSGSFWRLGDDSDGEPVWNKMPACSTEQPCTPHVRAFWGSGTTLWAVGMKGQAFYLDDPDAGHWAFKNPHTNEDLEGVWGSSPDEVWAVGQNGTIRRASSTGEWTAVASPTTEDLHAVWGSSANDVWAVGDNGTVLRYDGSEWQLASIGLLPGEVPTRLNAVWGSGPDDVWIVGNGLVLHRDGTSRKHP